MVLMNSDLKKAFFLLTWLLLVFSPEKAISQSVTLSTNTDSVSVGDVVQLNLKIQRNQEVSDIVFPDSSAFPPELTYLSIQQFQLTDFADSISYSVQYFANQDVYIPSFPIGLVNDNDTTVIYSNSITLPFRTVLSSADTEFKPIKPILDFDSFPWAILLITLVILAALVWAYFTYFKSEPVDEIITYVAPEPFVSPLKQLENELITLKQEYNLAETRDFKFFYSTISDSIRRYYEDLYDIPALESTTRELMRFLDAFGVDHEMIQSTRTVLNKSDMVKFAKFEPTLEKAWICYADAIDFTERAKLIDASRIARKKADHELQNNASLPAESLVEKEIEEVN